MSEDLLSVAVAWALAANERAGDMARNIGLCLDCYHAAWDLHCHERGGRLTLRALLHPWIMFRLAVWRWWVSTHWDIVRPLRQEILLSIGLADLYVDRHRAMARAWARQ